MLTSFSLRNSLHPASARLPHLPYPLNSIDPLSLATGEGGDAGRPSPCEQSEKSSRQEDVWERGGEGRARQRRSELRGRCASRPGERCALLLSRSCCSICAMQAGNLLYPATVAIALGSLARSAGEVHRASLNARPDIPECPPAPSLHPRGGPLQRGRWWRLRHRRAPRPPAHGEGQVAIGRKDCELDPLFDL